MKTRKTTLTTIFLLCFILFGCYDDSETQVLPVMYGKIKFTPDYSAIPVIELSNARQQGLIKKTRAWLTVTNNKTSKVVIDDWLDDKKHYVLEFGEYAYQIKILNESTGEVEGSGGGSKLVISQEAPQNLGIFIHVEYVMMDVFLMGFSENNAKVWIGEEGFTPGDEYLYTPYYDEKGYDPENTAKFHAPNDRFEVIVEADGETKKFGGDCMSGHYYRVAVGKKDDEPSVKTGSFNFWYTTAIEDSPDKWINLDFEF